MLKDDEALPSLMAGGNLTIRSTPLGSKDSQTLTLLSVESAGSLGSIVMADWSSCNVSTCIWLANSWQSWRIFNLILCSAIFLPALFQVHFICLVANFSHSDITYLGMAALQISDLFWL